MKLKDKGHIVPQFKKNSVKMVTLENEEGKKVNMSVAIMVANAFIPNPNNYKFIKHKDGDLDNCKADNLYWSETN